MVYSVFETAIIRTLFAKSPTAGNTSEDKIAEIEGDKNRFEYIAAQ